jgi:hypothetical protein
MARNKPGFLEPHRQTVVGWLTEGLSYSEIRQRFLDDHGIKCSQGALSEFITENGLAEEAARGQVEQAAAEPAAVTAAPSAVQAEPQPPLVQSGVSPTAILASKPEPWIEPPLPFALLGSGPWWTPDLPMLEFGEGGDVWTLRDACEGTFILGATGSGKTSGSGAAIARSFLERGFGGLVLTVKDEERRLWQEYAQRCGRSDHLCIVEPNGHFRLNFLDYAARRPGKGAGMVDNLVSLLYAIVEVQTRGQGDAGLQNFWENTGKQMLRNVLRVLEHSRPRLMLDDIVRFIIDAPMSAAEVESQAWKATRTFGPWLQLAIARTRGTPHEHVIQEACQYWLEQFPGLADKTRSCITIGFTATTDGFIEPVIHELFCTDTTLIPEAALEGAIIVIDLPLKHYETVGLFAQMAWKHLFQKAIERRGDPDLDDDPSRRPVFLWADEAQFFYAAYDGLFQSTARSSRCATVYLTQNLSNFYGTLAGSQARPRVDGFLGNLNTKIFHSNNDPTTNHWAAEQIGRSLTHRFSSNTSHSRKDFWDPSPNENVSAGMQEVIDYEVQPSAFSQLRTGGEQHDLLVDAYFVKSGAQFRATGKHYFKTLFQQEPRT